mmetsp:Transcript_90797/g.243167  ORF Transcript_90797/g.243167 Transcript_90797/m.243167 type:complete len:213 (-) Transcript_90797:12-650(-)
MMYRKDGDRGVPYLSKQNDSLRQETPVLLEDATGSRMETFAEDVFGCAPEAINLWIGDERAVSSVHKDFYENFYTVVRGVKRFVLLPPTDVSWLEEKQFRSARYVRTADGFAVEEEDDVVPWIEVDPAAPEQIAAPHFERCSPVFVEVREGETLFVPALWYHRVTQSEVTIAVNRWYDMDFQSPVFFLYQLVRDLAGLGDGEAGRDSDGEGS